MSSPLCLGATDVFFGHPKRKALDLCMQCGHRPACREDEIRNPTTDGVRAGFTAEMRRRYPDLPEHLAGVYTDIPNHRKKESSDD